MKFAGLLVVAAFAMAVVGYAILYSQSSMDGYSQDEEVKAVRRHIVVLILLGSIPGIVVSVIARYITKGLAAPTGIVAPYAGILATSAFLSARKRYPQAIEDAPMRDKMMIPILIATMRIEERGRDDPHILREAEDSIPDFEGSEACDRFVDGWNDQAYQEAAAFLRRVAGKTAGGRGFLRGVKRDFKRGHRKCYTYLRKSNWRTRTSKALQMPIDQC